MKEYGILFTAEMVRAILDGRKSLTSRLLVRSPARYGPVRRRLWVRETFYCDDFYYPNIPKEKWSDPNWKRQNIYYRADGDDLCQQIPECDCEDGKCEPWRPSILMPRWASRITLEVVKLWPSRLQDMTEEMAIQEGIEPPRCPKCGYTRFDCSFQGDHRLCGKPTPPSAIPVYAVLWDSINGKSSAKSWAANPWVWRIEFKRTEAGL